MRLVNRLANFFSERQFIQYLLIFAVSFVLFAYLHSDYTFADPDSFYHAKKTIILKDSGAITEFPWLSATNLKNSFIDHHFLYHLALIPFVSIMPPLLGLKLATILFSSLLVLLFFWFLKSLQIRAAFWYTFFLITINPFIFRINLAKAQAMVLILLFLILYCLLNKNYICLTLLSGLYVWLYGGWPLALVLVFVYGALSFFWPIQSWSFLVGKINRLKIYWQNFLLFISVSLGLLAGLFFNPYFPHNFRFYWEQTFKIAILNYQHVIGVGGEWYPYHLSDLILSSVPFFLMLFIALLGFIIFYKKQPMNSWFFIIISFLFFILTLKSRRYVEYFIPLAVCFSALSINAFWPVVEKKISKFIPKRFFIFLPLMIMVLFSPFFIRDVFSVKTSYRQGFPLNKFSEPSRWLKENAARGEIIFHSDWDEFPFLFFYNDQNYYLVGLDPTFMYSYDKDLYRRWVEITLGQEKKELYKTIKDIFGASYVFVDINQNKDFDSNLANNFYFEKVFENQEAKIYKVN